MATALVYTACSLRRATPRPIAPPAGVEDYGAICRYYRRGPETGRHGALERLATLAGAWIEVQPSESVRSLAEQHLERFPLRAADALQLAAAIAWCGQRPRGRLLLTADRALASAAGKLGFEVPPIWPMA